MRKELENISPEELEQAAQEAREQRAHEWDAKLADENYDLAADFDFDHPVKVKRAKQVGARATVGLRLARGEMGLIDEAAKRRGVTFSEFVRDAALAVASGSVSLEETEIALLLSDLRLRVAELDEALNRVLARRRAPTAGR